MKDMIQAGDVLDILDKMQSPDRTDADKKLHEAYQKVGLLWDAGADDDWEKVVRCKDCKHWKQFNCILNADYKGKLIYREPKEDFFCGNGEKK